MIAILTWQAYPDNPFHNFGHAVDVQVVIARGSDILELIIIYYQFIAKRINRKGEKRVVSTTQTAYYANMAIAYNGAMAHRERCR